MTSRVCWRQLRSIRRHAFSTSAQRSAASNFLMPAMSPTMTEGNITSWKVKEGETYTAGDVLLEIETDKATMDVEAQEDGVLAKILIGDGKKGVSVGTNIAVMAEAGDDLASLEMPKEEASTKPAAAGDATQKKQETETQESKSDEKPKQTTTKKQNDTTAQKSSGHATQTNKDGSALSPAVQFLLAQYNISDAHAVPATGPRGRLLKGDVLAYASKIDKSSAKIVADAFVKRGKLDLSNIKKAPMPAKAAKPEAATTEVKNPMIELRRQVNLNHLILLSERISDESGVEVTIEELTAKAAARALSDFPAFAVSDPSIFDQTFDEIVTGQTKPSLTSLPPLPLQKPANVELDATEYLAGGPIKLPARAPITTLLTLQAATPVMLPSSASVSPESLAASEYDIIDFLTDKPQIKPAQSSISTSPSAMIASLSFDENKVNPEKASIYLDRVSQYMESPAHLFL